MNQQHDKTLGWMGVNAQLEIYYHTLASKVHTHYESFLESDNENTQKSKDFAPFVTQRLEKLREFFTNDEWATLQRYHKFDDDVTRQRLLYHWLGLNDELIVDETHQIRKQLLLMLWDKEVFHPFVDIQEAEQIIIKNKYTNWILRLSTTKSGKITISYPYFDESIVISNYRINYTNNVFEYTDKKYDSIDDLIKQITNDVTLSVKQYNSLIDYVTPVIYD